jgi:hypothetical protein
MVGGQKIQVGLTHARKMAEVTVGADACQVTVEPGITITAPRTTSREIRRHKASTYLPPLTRGRSAGVTAGPGSSNRPTVAA